MKVLLISAFTIAIAVFFSLPGITLASGNDTLIVYANGPSLDAVINSDTTNSGAQAHNVYELVTLDTTYLFTGTATPKSEDITIIGRLGSDGRPPCVQPGLLQSGSLAGTFCTISKPGSNVLVRNIYFFGRGPNNAWTGNPLFTVPSDSTTLTLDSLVVDEVHGTTITYTGMYDNFYVSHSKFRNDVWPNNFTSPSVVNPAYPTSNPCDTCVINGNTFFCHEASVAGVGPMSQYVTVSHNTFVYNFEYPVGSYYYQYLPNERIINNVFYGTYAGAVTIHRYHTTHITPVQPVGIIEMDTLTLAEAKTFDPADSSNPNVRMLADAKRIAIVKDNVLFEPAAIDSFWTAWDDTASASDTLITPSFMSAETDTMFAHPELWPGYKASGNLIGVDPEFGASFQSVLQSNATPGVVSLQKFITEVWQGVIKTDEWGYQKQVVSGSNWVPQWPLPETSAMQYTNATVKANSTDGLPCGDPSWFGMAATAVNEKPAAVATKFELGNNYPNPFNPSTTIKVSLAKSGLVSLRIYNVLGQLVKVVDQGYKASGVYSYNVTLDNFASGVYFYTLQEGSNLMTKKMLLLK